MTLFKNHLKKVRPTLNIEKVATGEVWYGMDALSKGLCDEIATSDDVLLRMRADGIYLSLKNSHARYHIFCLTLLCISIELKVVTYTTFRTVTQEIKLDYSKKH